MRPRTFAPILVLLAIALTTAPAHAAGVVSVCDEPHLRTTLTGGGTVTFTCSGTITLASTISIAANTTIDGSGQAVVISGGGKVRVFSVSSGISLSLNRLTIADGRSLAGGGGVFADGGTITVSNSTFSGNRAPSAFDGGGAISVQYGVLSVSNSTFYGNSASVGGAIIASLSTVGITNSTFSGNSTPYGGDSIYNVECINCSSGTITLRNSIMADDALYSSCTGPNFVDGGGNLAYSDFSCPGIHVDAKLGPLQNNGGPTPTMALGTGSAAIDAANAATCAASPVSNLDQRGVARPTDGDGNGTPVCDIGAVEQQPVGAPHLPSLAVDIKPGSDPNTINCRRPNEVIAVGILTTDSFDAATVDHRSVTFAGAAELHVDRRTGQPIRHLEDVDGDGDTDLVIHVRLGSTGLTCESTLALLIGRTAAGEPIWGVGPVRTVGGD